MIVKNKTQHPASTNDARACATLKGLVLAKVGGGGLVLAKAGGSGMYGARK